MSGEQQDPLRGLIEALRIATSDYFRQVLAEQLSSRDERLADAEAEANNAMVQSLDNEKTIVTLQLQIARLSEKVDELSGKGAA
jgi:hypothetical protein